MNKKGFTLIELLAVIVILAIIALIATPIIMNTISKSQDEANERSLETFAAQLELGYADAMLTNPAGEASALQTAAETFANANVNGEKPSNTTITWNTTNTGVVDKIAAKYDNKDYCYTAANGAETKACS